MGFFVQNVCLLCITPDVIFIWNACSLVLIYGIIAVITTEEHQISSKTFIEVAQLLSIEFQTVIMQLLCFHLCVIMLQELL